MIEKGLHLAVNAAILNLHPCRWAPTSDLRSPQPGFRALRPPSENGSLNRSVGSTITYGAKRTRSGPISLPDSMLSQLEVTGGNRETWRSQSPGRQGVRAMPLLRNQSSRGPGVGLKRPSRAVCSTGNLCSMILNRVMRLCSLRVRSEDRYPRTRAQNTEPDHLNSRANP